MISCDLLIKAKQLITLEGGVKEGKDLLNLIKREDGIVAIKNKKIIFVGDEKEKNKFKSTEEIDASNYVLMPSFIDSHTHALFFGSREDEFELRIKGLNYMEILKKGGGIQRTVRLTKEAKDEEIIKETKERLKFMLEHGTTVIEIKSGYGIDYKEEIRELKLIKKIKNETNLTIIPTLLAHVPKGNKNKYVEGFCKELIPKVAKENLAKFVDVFCDVDVFDYKDSYKIFKEAEKYNFKLKIHAGEFGDIGCGRLFKEFKFTSVDHLIYLNNKDLKELIKNKTCFVLLPATSFSLMQKFCDARNYIQKGAIVALASDFSPASWICDMQSVISIACRSLKMTQAECINATTINAAYALNLHEKYGSIEKNKIADLIILNVPNYKWIGYTLGFNHVKFVIKNGKIVKEN